MLTDGTHKGDVSGRLGGDEFCILFPQTTLEDARICIERIRERLQQMMFGMGNGVPYTVTATFGVAQFHPGLTAAELMEAADKALYKAKQLGRNCTVAL